MRVVIQIESDLGDVEVRRERENRSGYLTYRETPEGVRELIAAAAEQAKLAFPELTNPNGEKN